jgi:modified peptide precursor CbpA
VPDHCRDSSRWEGFWEPPSIRKPVDLLNPRCDRESDGKGFRWALGVCRNPFLFFTPSQRKNPMQKKTKKDVIAYRKTCQAKGTGLSHYILMDKKAK